MSRSFAGKFTCFSLAGAILAGLVLALPLAADDDAKPEKPQAEGEKPAAEESAEDKLWSHDFAEAKAMAAEQGKDLLMEFTGSDWCPPCIALAKNVLSKEEFQSEAPKHFVLLKLDSPRDKSKQSKEEIEQCQELSKQYKIRGVPTMILADATGRPYAQFVGYGGDDAEAYTAKLVEKTTVRTQRDELFAQAASASGVEKAELLHKAINAIDAELAISTYRDTVDEIIALDSDDKGGLKSKYENLLKLSQVKEQLAEVQALARRDGDGAIKKIDEMVKELELTGPPLQEALYVKALVLYRTDKDACKKALEDAVAAAPDTPKAEQLRATIERAFPKPEDAPEGDKPKESGDQ